LLQRNLLRYLRCRKRIPGKSVQLLCFDTRDGVVQHVGAGNYLVEIPAEILSDAVVHGSEKVLAARVSKAPALEVGAESGAQPRLAHETLQGIEDQRGLGVGHGAIA